MIDPMVAVGRRLGTTPGQAWTLSLGTVLAAVLLGTSLPPVLDARGSAPAARAAGPPPALAPGGLTGLVPVAPAPLALPAPPATVPVPAPLSLPAPLPPAVGATGPVAPFGSGPAPEQAFSPPVPESAAPARPGAPQPAGPAAVTPLTVREAGFATSDPALLAPPVPDDVVPVSARLGRVREQAHVRLSGSQTDLRLQVDEGSQGADTAAVRACRITDPDWEPARPGPAIPFDPDDCAAGVREADGSLRFPLGRFPDRTGPFGFALVIDPAAPSGPAPRTFRLLLRPVPSPTPESSP